MCAIAYLMEESWAVPELGVLVMKETRGAELDVVVEDGRFECCDLLGQCGCQLSTDLHPEHTCAHTYKHSITLSGMKGVGLTPRDDGGGA